MHFLGLELKVLMKSETLTVISVQACHYSLLPLNANFQFKKIKKKGKKEARWSDWKGLQGRGCSSGPGLP